MGLWKGHSVSILVFQKRLLDINGNRRLSHPMRRGSVAALAKRDEGRGQIREWQTDVRGFPYRWIQMGQLPTLTFNWHQRLASATCVCRLLLMYMTWAGACVCAEIKSEGQTELYTHPHAIWVLGPRQWYEYGGVRPEGSVTLGQGDRIGQVCVYMFLFEIVYTHVSAHCARTAGG